jgi:Cu2+-exporting ATPase
MHISVEMEEQIAAWQKMASTVIYFGDDKNVLAVLAITDEIKPTSKQAIASLQAQGVEVYMLTGDGETTAAAVAREVGITHFKSSMLPSAKASFIKQLQTENKKVVAMVGDGINDSEALALADVSIAMGKGSDIAMDVAKITLITSDLLAIPKAITLSKQTVSTIKQNLFWAFIYNVIGIPLAAGVLFPINGFLLNPMIAGGAMALSSVSVVMNSLRLKWTRL